MNDKADKSFLSSQQLSSEGSFFLVRRYIQIQTLGFK